MKKKFTLGEKPFIELNKLLKLLDLASSGGEANMFISSGEVFRNGEVETRKRCKLKIGDVVTFQENEIAIN